MSDIEAWKRAAAVAAVDEVASGMLVGLGTGSTAVHAVREIGRRLAEGELRDVRGVPTSQSTALLAHQIGIPLLELPAGGVDVAIDGMDEVDGRLDCIKGLGGALTREKIVATSARAFVLVGDVGKRVAVLAARTPVPVEVLPFGEQRTAERLRGLGCEPRLRLAGGQPQVTDNGHHILDCHLAAGSTAEAVRRFAADVDRLPGVVAHGLFLGVAVAAYLAGPEGVVRWTGDRAAP